MTEFGKALYTSDWSNAEIFRDAGSYGDLTLRSYGCVVLATMLQGLQ